MNRKLQDAFEERAGAFGYMARALLCKDTLTGFAISFKGETPFAFVTLAGDLTFDQSYFPSMPSREYAHRRVRELAMWLQWECGR